MIIARARNRLGALRARTRGGGSPPLPRSLLELSRSGPAPLAPGTVDPRVPLKIATVIPSFLRASGGHATIVNLMRALRARGHSVSLWLDDCEGFHASEPVSATRRNFTQFFGAGELELHTAFDSWDGADVVLATGWQTVSRVLLLQGAKSRAYLVQDHEPDFYGASAQAVFAEATYRQGVHCIAASRWLAELLQARYGASASHFDLAVDHSVYRQSDRRRRDDLVVFYARAATPRRAVPLGLLALEELARRRPEVEIALFGADRPVSLPFRHASMGVLDAPGLARLYAQATVGMVFSLTNPSLIGLEMMACALPCVELATDSVRSTWGSDGPLLLAEADPIEVCSAVERLLDDRRLRAQMAAAGVSFMENRTWANAAEQVEDGLLAAWRAGT